MAITAAASKLGYSDVTSDQRLVVERFLSGSDVFVSLPTGSGKSLCYWMLPFVSDILRGKEGSIVLVVSPLIALMKDQVQSLVERGVSAVRVGECKGDSDTLQRILEGQYQILFFSPEELVADCQWRDMLVTAHYQQNVVALVVDEAHCVKNWAQEFRQEYANLNEVLSTLSQNVHIMALTATATRASRRSICRALGMENPFVVSKIPNRPNIYFSLSKKPPSIKEAFEPLVKELKMKRAMTDRAIIFCRTYDDLSYVYLWIMSALGKEAYEPIDSSDQVSSRLVDMFSACTEPCIRVIIHERFRDPDSALRIVIATIAFGMGLDCPNIRRIFHWGSPSDIETYVQETGRAGRDGNPAKAHLFYGNNRYVDEDMKEYCSNQNICRRKCILEHFDGTEVIAEDQDCACTCVCCDVCANQKCIVHK